MFPLIPILIKAILPVAVQQVADKLKEENRTDVKSETIVMKNVASGVVASKTMWFAFILAVLGVVQQYQGILTTFIGEDKTGIIMTVIAAIIALLRAVTNTSITEKGSE